MKEEEISRICKEAVTGTDIFFCQHRSVCFSLAVLIDKTGSGLLLNCLEELCIFYFVLLESGGDQQMSKNLSKDLRKRFRSMKQDNVAV